MDTSCSSIQAPAPTRWTLRFETYLLPAPEENAAAVYEYALRRNHDVYGVAFTIGEEDAIFLRGHLPSEAVTDAELDRILGTLYALTERHFRPLLGLAFASRLRSSVGPSPTRSGGSR